MVSDDDLLNCPKTYLVQQNLSQNTDFTPIGPGWNHGPFLGGSGARLLSECGTILLCSLGNYLWLRLLQVLATFLVMLWRLLQRKPRGVLLAVH